MARYALIDGYLETLRGTVRWRRDVDDLIAEIEDHLLSAVERFEARGADRMAAQQSTLEQFGDPDVLAKAFASTPQGGLAVPTSFTRQAGLFGMVAAGLMLLFPAAWTLTNIIEDRTGDWSAGERGIFMVATVGLAAALTLYAILMLGLHRRHGGLGLLGVLGLGIVFLAVPATLLSWFIAGWGVLLGAGSLLLAASMWNRGVAPRAALAAVALGMPIGIGLFLALSAAEFGWRDQWGDYPAAILTGLWVGIAITAAGSFGLGRFLRSEDAADLSPDQPVAA